MLLNPGNVQLIRAKNAVNLKIYVGVWDVDMDSVPITKLSAV
jgi:hypothetical protein